MIDHQRYANVRNQLRALTRSLRANLEQDIAARVKSNPKCFWNYVNSKLKTRSTLNVLKRSDGSPVIDDVAKADLLNEYFCSVFTTEDSYFFYTHF